MEELYKVRQVSIQILNNDTNETSMDFDCEFGTIIEQEGIKYLECYIFEKDVFDELFRNYLDCHAKAKMVSFDYIDIEIPYLAITSITNKENKVTFKCLDYIQVYKENSSYYYLKSQGKKLEDSQLLRIDFWGLHLLTKGNQSTELMVSDAPFLMTLRKNDDNGIMHACFPAKDTCVHNTLTEDLYKEFRMSLCGYLSLINGAQVQITQEYFNGYSKVYSYKKIENTSCSNYACGDVKFFNPSPILFEFDNYVRWDKNLNLSKFIFHICSAQQLQYLEDRSFILILAFEGLCKKYLEIQKKEHLPQEILPADDFDRIKKGFHEILKNEYRCGVNLGIFCK